MSETNGSYLRLAHADYLSYTLMQAAFDRGDREAYEKEYARYKERNKKP